MFQPTNILWISQRSYKVNSTKMSQYKPCYIQVWVSMKALIGLKES